MPKPLIVASLALCLLAACAPTPQESATFTATPEHWEPATQAAPAPALPASATASAPQIALTKQSCLAAGGRVEQVAVESEILDHPLAARIYTPPCYAENADTNYPVLYLIHGQTYNEDQWDRLGADEAADALIGDGELAPFIIVMPADESHYTQPSKNGFDEAVVDELIPWVEANYRTKADRQQRAVGGLSRGASWAIHLALTHPELFGAVAGHSPPVFQEDAGKVHSWLDGIPAEQMPRIWLDIGERDQRAILDSAIWFEGLLNERDIPHDWSLFSGDHSEAYWSSHVELYLRWYAAEW